MAALLLPVGARHVVISDVNTQRLELAKMGATRAVDVTKEKLKDVMKDLGMSEGFDVALEMSGHPQAFQEAIELLNHGGRLALLGIFADDVSIDWSQVVFKGLQIKRDLRPRNV